MKPNLSVRATYIVETPELWYLIGRETLRFKVENDFYASMVREKDLQLDGQWADSIDSRLVFEQWVEAESPILEVVEKLPPEGEVESWRPNFAMKDVKPIEGFANRYAPPWIPLAFWKQAEEWRKALDRRACEVVGELCWRLGIHDGPSRLTSNLAGLSISPLEGSPRGLPIITLLSPDDQFWNPRRVDSEQLKAVLNSIGAGTKPPIHHELLQDAWKRCSIEPRVAVVMGVAAAETAVKAIVAELLPETRWILENLAAPPITKIIAHQIPLLPSRNKISGAVCIPTKLRTKIDKHVELRNRIVHGRGGDVPFEIAETVLQDVRDLLCLIDYYAGHDWAIELVSSKWRGEAEKDAAAWISRTPINT
jgi:hypothetical protein